MVVLAIILLIVLVAICVVIAFLVPLKAYFKALFSGAHISMKDLASMKMRKIKFDDIVDVYITAKKGNLEISLQELESHYLSNGNIYKLVNAMILARSLGVGLDMKTAKGLDLAKRDLMEVIKSTITPKIVKTPKISAVAMDGMEVIVYADISLKSIISEKIDAVSVETIISRAQEAIVTFIGRAQNYHVVLSNAIEMSNFVMRQDIARGSNYQVLSVNIESMATGQNIAGNMRVTEAEMQAKINKSKLEEKRISAQIREQEMKAKTQEMKALLLASESEVHKAMAKAFRDGQMGVLDYYKLQNVMADTNLRNALSGKDNKDDDDDDDFDPFSRFGSGNPFRGGSSSRGGTQVIPDKMANRMR